MWLNHIFLYLQCVASPVLENVLQQSIIKNGMRYIKIPGVPYEAVQIFIRFLYSSWYVRIILFRKFVFLLGSQLYLHLLQFVSCPSYAAMIRKT